MGGFLGVLLLKIPSKILIEVRTQGFLNYNFINVFSREIFICHTSFLKTYILEFRLIHKTKRVTC